MVNRLLEACKNEINELIDISNEEYNTTTDERIKDKALAQCGAYENVLYVIRKYEKEYGIDKE